MTINDVIRFLAQEYGLPQWQSQHDPLSELIRAILSQNTSDVNSHRAFDSLISTFGTWDRVAEASIDEIAKAIACGGLSRIKAPRIKSILNRILNDHSSLDLGFLGQLPLPEARAWLQSLPGVGPKTANCVLLFSLRMPALPVDTHVYRICRRLGLIGPKVSPARAHQVLEELIRPRCSECILLEGCVYGKGAIRATGS